MTITLEPIRPQEIPALRNLWELYVHDFSEFVRRAPGVDGRFETEEQFASRIEPPLELLWIRREGTVAGFVFIRPCSHIDGNPSVSDIDQFFVLRGHRRAGVGRAAAALAFARRPGRWEIRQTAANLPAQRFWRPIIAELTAGHFQERELEQHGMRWFVQTFAL